VVNTLTGDRGPQRDGFEIRRAAAERRVPCFTSLDTLRVAAEALAASGGLLMPRPMSDYLPPISLSTLRSGAFTGATDSERQPVGARR
jgi:hypothetical protein